MVNFIHNYTIIYYLFIVIFATVVTSFAIPSILHVARFRHLYDDLGHFRKMHDHGIPRLGGVAIFVGFTITLLLFCMSDKSLPINYLLAACIMIFAMGLKDDLSGVNSSTKFIIQAIVGAILVIFGNIRLTSMYGVFGIYNLSYFLSVCVSILIILLIVNAFNLIDGIDGLAATTGIVANVTFGALFIYIRQYELAAVSFAMAGAVVGFLRFNLSPAKIFMGDTGSLLIGLISAVMALKFMEAGSVVNTKLPGIYCVPALTVAILIGPVFDTMRVFVVRITNGVSPFAADRNHIHHRMLKLGFNHVQITLILTSVNIASIAMVLLFKNYGNSVLIALIILVSLVFNWLITFFIRSKERESLAVRNLFA